MIRFMPTQPTPCPTTTDPDRVWAAACLAAAGAFCWVFGGWLYLVVGPGSLRILQHDARLILTVTGILGTALILAGAWTYVRRAR